MNPICPSQVTFCPDMVASIVASAVTLPVAVRVMSLSEVSAMPELSMTMELPFMSCMLKLLWSSSITSV